LIVDSFIRRGAGGSQKCDNNVTIEPDLTGLIRHGGLVRRPTTARNKM